MELDTFKVTNLSVKGSRVVVCVEEHIASIVETELSKKGDVTVSTLDTYYVEFDEGRSLVIPADRQVVSLDRFKFAYFIPDFSSLMFELNAALNETYSEKVTILSKVRNIALSRSDAYAILDFLNAKYSELKEKESKWFEEMEDQLTEAEIKDINGEYPN